MTDLTVEFQKDIFRNDIFNRLQDFKNEQFKGTLLQRSCQGAMHNQINNSYFKFLSYFFS